MKNHRPNLCFLILLSAATASAEKYETFAERPAMRQGKVEKALQKSQRERAEAREWARKKGIKVREDTGWRVRELMAVRNGRPVYYSTKNFNAAISTAADKVRNTAPYSVDGTGVTVGVWDGGSVLTTHTEFTGDRVVSKDAADSHYHATHVGGTIGARGANSAARGMAPNVHIDSYDWDGDGAEMLERAAAAPGEPGKIYLSNHSYGYLTGWERDDNGDYVWFGDSWNAVGVESFFGQYVEEAAGVDGLVYDAPYYLPFKAAGNDRSDNPSAGATVYNGSSGSAEAYSSALHPKGDGIYKNGYDTLGPVGAAKNIMTVGAVDKAVSGTSRWINNADMASFSSWGPADDGRIKPDIVAQGVFVNSCDNDHDSDYIVMSGTSMATPNACGSAALLVNYYDLLFSGQAMRASTLKGLIIHTADDLGRPGPDYQYGWGLMNTLAAASLIRDYAAGNQMRMTEDSLSASNRSDRYSIFCPGADSLRITLCWTDPAGAATVSHDDRVGRLVNDLDLKITGPDGVHYPYKLNYASPSDNATSNSENDVDNIEQVYIESPVAGSYDISIDYDGTLRGGLQHYSLLINGIGSDSDLDKIPDFWESRYFSSATGADPFEDPDRDGADNLTEYITGFDPLDPTSVFKVLDYSVPESDGAPFVLTWEPKEGRIYQIMRSWNLQYAPFSENPVSDELPYPVNSYTDTVSRPGSVQFYRIDVKLDQ